MVNRLDSGEEGRKSINSNAVVKNAKECNYFKTKQKKQKKGSRRRSRKVRGKGTENDRGGEKEKVLNKMAGKVERKRWKEEGGRQCGREIKNNEDRGRAG